jgi:glutamyl-tRNA reductase
LYNIDDLQGVADENLQERASEAEKAEEIVREEVENFLRWLASLEQVPTITALRQRFEEIRQREIEKSLGGNLKDLSAKQRDAVQEMTAAMVNKMLHGPISQLKRNSANEDEDATLYVAALRKLFNLEKP